jgi:multimeric flavodoxin WrbA
LFGDSEMKIIGIIGSSRKFGNTDILVRTIVEAAAAQGAETRLFHLRALTVNACLGCEFCRANDGCAQSDDMQYLYPALQNADVVVVGSPVYMGQVSGQTKIFMDRLFALLNNDFSSRLPAGKQAVLVFAQAQPDAEQYARYFQDTARVFEVVGLPVVKMLVAANVLEQGAVADDIGLLAKAAETGRQLVENFSKANLE